MQIQEARKPQENFPRTLGERQRESCVGGQSYQNDGYKTPLHAPKVRENRYDWRLRPTLQAKCEIRIF